jgi:hypothetical protein
LPPSITATQLLVVPRSMPITLAIRNTLTSLDVPTSRRASPHQAEGAADVRGAI